MEKELFRLAPRTEEAEAWALRPEATAGIVRAFVQHGMQTWPQPVKLTVVGPMFRYDRPQAGRYRQFWQWDAEAIGDPGPAVDAEMVEMGYRFYVEAGVPDVQVLLNSIGDGACRPAYLERLTAYFRRHEAELPELERRRLDANPLRLLDSKDPALTALVAAAPRMGDCLCEACAAHFAAVRAHLDAIGVPYRVEPTLVRGLDYYTRTAFEYYRRGAEGQQQALGGGGRYDGLVELLGGRPTPGIGFALGLDRVLLALDETGATAARRAAAAGGRRRSGSGRHGHASAGGEPAARRGAVRSGGAGPAQARPAARDGVARPRPLCGDHRRRAQRGARPAQGPRSRHAAAGAAGGARSRAGPGGEEPPPRIAVRSRRAGGAFFGLAGTNRLAPPVIGGDRPMEGAVERELVLAARRGDEVAFARLIEAEAPRIYRAVLAVVRSPEDAQEVMQDASIRAWRQLRGLREADQLAGLVPADRRPAGARSRGRQGRIRLREVSLELAEGRPARPELCLIRPAASSGWQPCKPWASTSEIGPCWACGSVPIWRCRILPRLSGFRSGRRSRGFTGRSAVWRRPWEMTMAIDDPGMTDREERAAASLRRALRDVAEEHPVRVDGAAWVRSAANRRTSLSLRLALAGALVLALLVALGGMGAFHTRPRAASTPTQVTSATNAANSPSPSQAESGPVIGPWEDALSLSEKLSQIINSDMDESFGSASNGVVAIKVYGAAPGGEPIQHIVSVYRSFDGRTWTETQVPNPNNAQNAAVACRGASCVVVVQSGGEAGVLEVTDDGRDWSELPLPSNLWQSSIVAGNDCFLLYGFDTTTGQYKLLRSPDGENWTSTVYATGSPPLTKGLWVGYDPTAGWIALGGFADGQSAEGRVPVATSEDGLTWTDAVDESAVYKMASEVSEAVVHFGDRWYLYTSYATFPSGVSPGGGFPGFFSGFPQRSPTASWQTVYWLQDGSRGYPLEWNRLRHPSR